MNVKGEASAGHDRLDRDLLELVGIMPQVMRGLKRGAAGGPPQPLQLLFSSPELGPRHLPVLIAVALNGPSSVGEIAERIGVGLPATSLMVGELDRAGVLERHSDPEDRRRTLVSLCDEHRDAVERLAFERLAPLRRALERMGSRTRSEFIAGWRVLAEEVAGDGGAASACSG